MSHASLSICIPTYNRVNSVVRLVTQILDCEGASVEVVVLDNASSDDTVKRLRLINDRRLTVHQNEVNRGVLFNVVNVLDRARGKFAALLLDKDRIDATLLPDFCHFLEAHPGVACGYCDYGHAAGAAPTTFAVGWASLRRFGYLGHHPTGYFFRVQSLRSLNITSRFNDYSFVGHFPFDFMLAELSLVGDGAVFRAPVFAPETEDDASRHRSVGTNASTEDAFFSPAGRLKMAINFSCHARSLALPKWEMSLLVATVFLRGFLASTRDFRRLMANPKLCAHYHIESRRVGWREVLRNGRHFYVAFMTGVFPAGRRESWWRFHCALVALIVGKLMTAVGIAKK